MIQKCNLYIHIYLKGQYENICIFTKKFEVLKDFLQEIVN